MTNSIDLYKNRAQKWEQQIKQSKFEYKIGGWLDYATNIAFFCFSLLTQQKQLRIICASTEVVLNTTDASWSGSSVG